MSTSRPLDIYGKPYNRSLLVMVLLIGTFCTVLNQTLLTTAFPTLMDAFDISASAQMTFLDLAQDKTMIKVIRWTKS